MAFLLLCRAAEAQEIKPYALIILDNSAGMAGVPLDDAKGALRGIVAGTGEIVFGLERFHGSCFDCTTCTARDCTGCTAVCPIPGACHDDDDGDVLVGFTEDNATAIVAWVDESCGGGDTAADPEILAVGSAPLHGSLGTALRYYSLGGAWVGHTYGPVITADPYRGCRPYYVVLIGGGDDDCGGCPAEGATALRDTVLTGLPCATAADCCPAGTCRTSGAGTPTCAGGLCRYDVRTWVVGVRAAAPYAPLEALATAGGTDCAGPYIACYADDETGLAAALADIVAASVATEVCNGLDDDCDGETDEPGACSDAYACVSCACTLVCNPDVEFACPAGLACRCGLLPLDPTVCVCQSDPCYDVLCPSCRTCADDGECVPLSCPECQRCDPALGGCEPIACPECQWCDPAAGRCVECPEGTVCAEWGCMPVVEPEDGGTDGSEDAATDETADDVADDAGSDGAAPGVEVIGTGGGGCTCGIDRPGGCRMVAVLLLAVAAAAAGVRRRSPR